jgi:hypothetical protein
MSDLLDKLKVLNENKDEIIKKVREIEIGEITTTQAQNLREYAAHTESIEEILLYIEYQNARERKFAKAGPLLIKYIKNYQSKGIDIIRYMLGIFARWVIIKTRRGD